MVKLAIVICDDDDVEEETRNENKRIVTASSHEVKILLSESGASKSYECDFQPFVLQSKPRSSAHNNDVNKVLTNSLLDEAFRGHNVTLVTQGSMQAGTSIIHGHPSKPACDSLIAVLLDNLFHQAISLDKDTSFRCQISFIEICGELITDLLTKRGSVKSVADEGNLKVKEDVGGCPYVDNLGTFIVTSASESLQLYEKGVKSRKRLAALDPNSNGYAHGIFTILLTQARFEDNLPLELHSKISIIDLGNKDGYCFQGEACTTDDLSESLTDMEVEDTENEYKPLENLQNIIRILATSSHASMNISSRFYSFDEQIPYSKTNLTWLLKEAFGGNCVTIILCCISCRHNKRDETLSTLKLGNLARLIKNRVCVNEDKHILMIRQLKKEIQILQNVTEETQVTEERREKLEHDQALVNRLTGIWEEKWNKSSLVSQETGLSDLHEFCDGDPATKEPHLVFLGSAQLRSGSAMMTIKQGFTRVGSGEEDIDLQIPGAQIESLHCLVEYNGDVVLLHPKGEHISIDGLPIATTTQLTHGCVLCLGKTVFLRFCCPFEAKDSAHNRFSIVPDNFVNPDVQLSIVQRQQELLEKQVSDIESQCWKSLEEMYEQSFRQLLEEKQKCEYELDKLKVLQQEQYKVATQIDHSNQVHIQELTIQHKELEILRPTLIQQRDIHNERLTALMENDAVIVDGVRLTDCQESPSTERTKLELLEFECLEQSLSEQDGSNQSTPDMVRDFRTNILIQQEVNRNNEEDEMLANSHEQLTLQLWLRLESLQHQRKEYLSIVADEKQKLDELEKRQVSNIENIVIQQEAMESRKKEDKSRFGHHREQLTSADETRLLALRTSVADQLSAHEDLKQKKNKLFEQEKLHRSSLKMVSRHEELGREQTEHLEAEQMMLEELEQKQFEFSRQLEYKNKLLNEELVNGRAFDLTRVEQTQQQVDQLNEHYSLALTANQQKRKELSEQLELEEESLADKRELLRSMEQKHAAFLVGYNKQKQELFGEIKAEEKQDCYQNHCIEVYWQSKLDSAKVKLDELKQKQQQVISEETSKLEEKLAMLKLHEEQLKESSRRSAETDAIKNIQLENCLNSPASISTSCGTELDKRDEYTTPELTRKFKTESLSNGSAKRIVSHSCGSLKSGSMLSATFSMPSVFSEHEFDLLTYVTSVGHVTSNCPFVRVDSYSCRGYLSKMSKRSRLSMAWKKRWFVFDRKLGALCYYGDDRKTKAKGSISLNYIQEVYVDTCVKRSPHPSSTFCVRTINCKQEPCKNRTTVSGKMKSSSRTLVLCAPDGIVMALWIDVICTGVYGNSKNKSISL